MKIAFITPRMTIGGAETYIIRKSKWLINNGYEVIVISEGGESVKTLDNTIKHFTIKGIEMPPYIFKKEELSSIIKSVTNILIEEKVDIIEAHNNYPAIYAILSLKKVFIPLITNILIDTAFIKNPLLYILCKNLQKYDSVYAISKQTSVNLNKAFFKNIKFKILNIPLNPPKKNLPQLTEKYILSVSRMSSEKMYVKELINSYVHLSKKNVIPADIKLLIIGDGPLFTEVKKMAIDGNKYLSSEKIILLGYVTGIELDIYFHNCILYVGMGTTLLNAASYKKPCLLPGFEKKTMNYTWGFWGEEDFYKDYIVGDQSLYMKKNTYDNSLSFFFGNQNIQKYLGNKAYELYSSYFTLDEIMKEWDLVYKKCFSYKKEKRYRKFIDKTINRIDKLNRLLSFYYQKIHIKLLLTDKKNEMKKK